ncbi:kinase-like domain-containing protein [Suillus ampliporus]|nr:kinase-like domain-containing protein [Suillus ampliporus]
MGCCLSLFRKRKQTGIIGNGNTSDEKPIVTTGSARFSLTIPEPMSDTTSTLQTEQTNPSPSQAEKQLDSSIPSSSMDGTLVSSLPQPVTTIIHEVQPVTFDADPSTIQFTIKKQSDYPTLSGGLGDIWRCSSTAGPATEVAVKAIRIEDTRNQKAIQQATKRLRREVAVWIKLRHAHIITLHGTVSGFGPLPALVSTWMDNGALHCYLKCTVLTMGQKLQLLKQVVDGLGYLHKNGIIHGDLTSTNVVIDRGGNAFLADFGLSVALVEADRSYYNSYSNGAMRWLAPELMDFPEPESINSARDGDSVVCDDSFPKPNSRSDIYSLGCIMLEVFSGKLPFWWLGKVQHICGAHVQHTEPYRLESKVPVDPQHLEFMRKCWSVKPESRPSIEDAASFVEDELAKVFSPPSN